MNDLLTPGSLTYYTVGRIKMRGYEIQKQRARKILAFASVFFVFYQFSFCFISPAFSQADAEDYKKKNVSVLPFDGSSIKNWDRRSNERYGQILADKITTLIIQSGRFNVIDRKNLEKIMTEQNFSQTGIIDVSTTVQMGKVSGVQKFVVGSITGITTDYHAAKTNSQGKTAKAAYYTSKISSTIKMLDVERSQYGNAAETSAEEQGTTESNAITKTLNTLALNVFSEFETYFAIQTYIRSVDNSIVNIDRGSNAGVRHGMDFVVYSLQKSKDISSDQVEINSGEEEIGLLKITSVEEKSAAGRLFGEYSQVSAGNIIRETKREVYVEAKILEKSFGRVVVNVGQDLEIHKGSAFSVIKNEGDLVDPVTGEVYGSRVKTFGTIIITEVHPKSSVGKILKGRYSIKEGMTLKERTYLNGYLILSMGGMVSRPIGELNQSWKVYNIDNWGAGITEIKSQAEYDALIRYRGHQIQEVDYREMEEIPDLISGFQISAYIKQPVNRLSVGLDLNGYISDEIQLNAFSLDLSVNKDITVIPEILFLSPGIGLGFGIATTSPQAIQNIVGILTDNQKSSVSANSLFGIGKLASQFQFGDFSLWGGTTYRTLRFDEWGYTVGEGENSERKTIDSKLLPYPDLKIPLTISVGLTYTREF